MVRPDQDRIGGKPEEIVEADETWIGGRTRGKGRGVHDRVLVAGVERGDMQVAETFLPIIHLVFPNLKIWLRGVSPQHLDAYIDEFTFRFNRRFYSFNAFRSLLGIAGDVTAPTYAQLYATKSRTTTSSGWV